MNVGSILHLKSNYEELDGGMLDRKCVCLFRVPEDDCFISYNVSSLLGIAGVVNCGNEPIGRMVIPSQNVVEAFCGMITNRIGIALAEKEPRYDNGGWYWRVYATIGNTDELEEYLQRYRKREERYASTEKICEVED